MKKNILAFAILSVILWSCDNASGGNKAILPVESNPHTEAHTDPSVHAEPSKTEEKAASQPENKKTDSATTKTEPKKTH